MIDLLDATTVQKCILAVIWLQFLWELYLDIRQHILCKSIETVPTEVKGVMLQETFDKARKYTLDKSTFSIVREVFSVLLSTYMIHNGIFYQFWSMADDISPIKGEIPLSCVWIVFSTTFETIIKIPFNVYETFILEERYGFNKQTAGFFIIDKIKSFFLNQIITMFISSFAIYIVQKGGDYFFLWLWLMVSIVVLILLMVYPSYIAPLFDKYTPLPEGELRSQIESLASSLNFPLGQLYVVEGSKRSAHSNAFFYGLFGAKRIVLFDTLLPSKENTGCSNEEILAVLSHELGHWKNSHIYKNLVIVQANLLLMFATFAVLFKFNPLYTAVGFPPDITPILVGLIVVTQFVMAPYNALLSFVLTVLSRRFEFQADEFASRLGRGEHLKNALVKLNKDNLGFPIYDYLYSSWHLSHPPLLERINAITETKKTK